MARDERAGPTAAAATDLAGWGPFLPPHHKHAEQARAWKDLNCGMQSMPLSGWSLLTKQRKAELKVLPQGPSLRSAGGSGEGG